MDSKNKHDGFISKKIIISLLLIIVVIAISIVAYKSSSHKSLPVSASSYTKGVIQSNSPIVSKGDASSQQNGTVVVPPSTDNGKVDSNSGAETSDLIAPTGDFVSNHRPNLSGHPAPNTESSVCTTNPGASCTIDFTNVSDGTVKSLSPETTDAGGSAYWSWSLQSEGLTAGTWHITASATLGSQSKSSADAMNMVVSQ